MVLVGMEDTEDFHDPIFANAKINDMLSLRVKLFAQTRLDIIGLCGGQGTSGRPAA